MPKHEKKSPIHGHADANITCDFGDGAISRCRSRLPHGHTASHIVSSIIVGLFSPDPDPGHLRRGPRHQKSGPSFYFEIDDFKTFTCTLDIVK